MSDDPFTAAELEAGHAWLYCRLVRRDAWRIGRLGFGVMRMPRRGDLVRLYRELREARRAAHSNTLFGLAEVPDAD